MFSLFPSDMLGIDTRVVCQRLEIDPVIKPMSGSKRKVGKDKRETIGEEVQNLRNDSFITKIKYPSWLAYIFLSRNNQINGVSLSNLLTL